MKAPRILVLRAPGVNCDVETEAALKFVGGAPEPATMAEVRAGRVRVLDYAMVVFPGGFSYGDDLGAGKILAVQIRSYLKDLRHLVRQKRPVLGVCNGFQALVKAGLLPFGSGEASAGFAANDSGRFEARWVHLRLNTQSSSLFFRGLPEMIELPVAHGEGKLVLRSPRLLEDLKKNHSIAMQYVSDDGKLAGYPANPNGSVFNIAALSNPEGNCLGLMPHPERFTAIYHHPNWTRQTFFKHCVGLEIFRNAVEYCRS
ncbi:MAG: phosphoribosylformylglycinamidine synthase I [Elusimicrobia bacterium]|nr:phosphoribosylformylglycinamidine synthase I [Elusimicrobiota bacterium]MDE2314671.1 phosphoribosylformylglycinamidine synthase I [Elusimicrobiota bacterium]